MSEFPTDNGNQPLLWLREAEQLLTGLAGAEVWLREAVALRHRLSADERWVAVFGAFSAGKSSLINALLGDDLLVVSPNPTTAAVTRVQGTRDGQSAGAQVRAKSAQGMTEDVFLALTRLRRQAGGSLAEALTLTATLKPVDFPSYLRPQVSFLKFAAAGWSTMGARLGQTWPVGREDLAQVTAVESLACYVEGVDIRTANPWLDNGLSLVDTPGVDSIHRRHAELAFEYSRRADAVLFVLYYTHAFSRADKDFLSQLAGVQDVIGSDKLFVVINAVDLATHLAERQAVRDRVVQELQALGLGDARVYEVSSQLALAAAWLEQRPGDERASELIRLRLGLAVNQPLPTAIALAEQSGVLQLRAEMTTWLQAQRRQLQLQTTGRLLAAVAQGSLTWVQRLRHQLAASVEQQQQLAQERETLRARGVKARQHFEDGSSELEHALREDWAELVFHAGERLRIGLPGLFRESFHPGRFRNPGTTLKALQEAADELADTLGRQVDREVRTFSLRTEKAVLQGVQQLRVQWTNRLAQVHGLLHGSTSLAAVSESETWVVGVRADVPTVPILAQARLFKNANSFFEGGGQRAMQVAVEQDLLPILRTELGRWCDQVVEQSVANLRDQTTELLTDVIAVLSDTVAEMSRSPGLPDGASNSVQLARWEAAAEWFQQAAVSAKQY
ncbi:hypothetical protein D2Q93_03445 [Alicyclobacillaceae bacterium I2511]|nr:hypothetical protein D2Q93_03445 [Alicyclobacillaceae bacterium I2511]